jgi:hypothetical protein
MRTVPPVLSVALFNEEVESDHGRENNEDHIRPRWCCSSSNEDARKSRNP